MLSLFHQNALSFNGATIAHPVTTSMSHASIVMMAKKKAIDSQDAASLGVDASGSTANIASHSPPAEKAPGQMFEGASTVDDVVQKLRNEAKVI